MAQDGILIISDITGYSSYIKQSELEHARGSLTDLLNLLIAYNHSPLVISKLEGDAIFSYAPARAFLQGQTLLEMVELTYVSFRHALELMIRNTNCQCNACRNLPNLDLKFFVHFGNFSTQELGKYQELIGNDVNLVHRLAKNKIKDQTGLRAYAAYTQAAIDFLKLGEFAATLIAHREAFADVGEVQLYVQDMHGVWERRREAVRVVVKPAEALMTVEEEYPVPAALLWDYVTRPDYRILFVHSTKATLSGTAQGRIAPGTVYVCAHGNAENPHTVLDWQPFEQYTCREATGFGSMYIVTTRQLIPTATGTRLRTILSRTQGVPWFQRMIGNLMVAVLMRRLYPAAVKAARQRMAQDLAQGVTEVAPEVSIEPEAIVQAAAEAAGGGPWARSE